MLIVHLAENIEGGRRLGVADALLRLTSHVSHLT
jgi:hypothetical protein